MKHAKVLHWDDERSFGNGIMITTAKGWAFEPSDDENVASHVKGFDRVGDARAKLKWVKPCSCARCQRQEV